MIQRIDVVDAARDDLVNDMVAAWKEEQARLIVVKATAIANIDSFLELSISGGHVKEREGRKNYDVTGDTRKFNVALLNYAQTKKVTMSYADKITFTEKLMDAKQHIDNLINEKSQGVDEVTQALLLNAFTLTDGRLNVAEILRLRRISIKHPEWEAAKQAIAESILPVGAKGYVRVYQRDNIDSEWQAISLDIAAL